MGRRIDTPHVTMDCAGCVTNNLTGSEMGEVFEHSNREE